MSGAVFAVPGDLATPTGGYAYARRVLAEAGADLTHLALPGGFPDPSAGELAETRRLLGGLPDGEPILIDGLALGVLPPELLRALPGPVAALCHHPLALETGIARRAAARLRAAERAALAACAKVIATSAATAAILGADYGVPEGRLTVACPGTDKARRAARSGGGTVSLLSVGSLTPRKGHDVLIAALARLAGYDWRLTIVGPADRDAAHAAELARMIGAAGLRDRVTLAGALEPGALERAYSGASLFVLASRYEGFGMAYAEAMAHGLPVVGCAAGAVAEATRGVARLVKPDDVDGLRAVLELLITDADERFRLAEDCWRAAQGFVSWSETAATVMAALRGLAA